MGYDKDEGTAASQRNGRDDREERALKLATVIILSYHNLDRIFVTLDSVFCQDYPEMELVISDDASADYQKWRPDIAAYVETHRNERITDVIWVSHPQNVGTVRNSNDAIRASHGDYILSLAPEDELAHEKALSNLIRTLEETGRDICFGRLRGMTVEGQPVDYLLSCESDYDLLKSYTVEQTRNRLFSRNFLPAPAALMTRRLFEENGLYPESIRLIEDYSFWLILTKNGVPFAYLDEVVTLYKLSGVSSTGHYSEAFMKDMYRIYDQFIFPYDRRFGPFQGIYNLLKKHGLDYYTALARWPKLSPGKRAWLRIRYLPFFIYTGWLNRRTARRNAREQNGSGQAAD